MRGRKNTDKGPVSMYKEKMIASLQAGEITDLQQSYLKQEFTKALEKLGFILQESKKCSLSFKHTSIPEVHLALNVAQDCGEQTEALATVRWGTWEIQDEEGQPLCANGQDVSEGSACAGFWMEGLESIPG